MEVMKASVAAFFFFTVVIIVIASALNPLIPLILSDECEDHAFQVSFFSAAPPTTGGKEGKKKNSKKKPLHRKQAADIRLPDYAHVT